jgi:hypothetical protein
MLNKIAIALLSIVLILSGCTSDKTTSIDLDNKNSMVNETIGIEPTNLSPKSKVSTSPKGQGVKSEETYCELRTDFNRGIERAKWEIVHGDKAWDLISCIAGIRESFANMLSYRQSLDDFDESMEFEFDDRFGSKISIDVGSVFTDGETHYRILTFSSDNFADIRLYIQVFDEETVVAQCIYKYWSGEGGVEGRIEFCGFQQDTDKVYLVIIHSECVIGHNSYCLINYEIMDREIKNYGALREKIAYGIWTVEEEFVIDESIPFEAKITKVACGRAWKELLNFDNNSQLFFEDNTLAIILDNDEKDEISLLLKDAFWEVIDVG